jgi:hypothetical protein
MEPDAAGVGSHARKPSFYQRISNAIFGKKTEAVPVSPPTIPLSKPASLTSEGLEAHQYTQELLLRTSVGSSAWQSALIAFASYSKQEDLGVPEFEIMREAFTPVEEHPMLKKLRTDEEVSHAAYLPHQSPTQDAV